MAIVGAFLVACAVLLMVGSSTGVLVEASQEEKGRPKATEEQEHSGGAAPEEERCEGTRRNVRFQSWFYLTNDVPGCPKGGLLYGTDKADTPPDRAGLEGLDGDDEIRGLDGADEIYGGPGNDVVYGGPGYDGLFSGVIEAGMDEWDNNDVLYGGDQSDDLWAGNGEDVLYGGDGDDRLIAMDFTKDGKRDRYGGRDKLYCGKGTDKYMADPSDYVSSSCEESQLADTGGPPLALLAGAALLGGLALIRHAIRTA
jgi:hypothetical protein